MFNRKPTKKEITEAVSVYKYIGEVYIESFFANYKTWRRFRQKDVLDTVDGHTKLRLMTFYPHKSAERWIDNKFIFYYDDIYKDLRAKIETTKEK